MRLLGEIAVLLGVYKLRILAVGDCYTDLSTILVFVCKNRVARRFGQMSARGWHSYIPCTPIFILAQSGQSRKISLDP